MDENLKDQALGLDEVVAKLEPEGFRFNRFELTVDDPCRPVDVEWNYKDMVHVGYVHSHMSRKFMYIGKSAYTTFDLQKFLGMTIPQSAAFYVTHDNRIVVNTTLFFYVILVEIRSEAAGAMLTRTTTRYAVGARSSLLRLFTPVLRMAIERNWKRFTKDDRSLRTRRGQLRTAGYEFYDESPIDHRETLRVTGKGLEVPESIAGYRHEVRLAGSGESVHFVGSDDHLGLQVHVDTGTIRVFPRLCPHRGALLDVQKSDGGLVECPWHGRKFRSLASIPRDSDSQTFEGPFHRCRYDGDTLSIETKDVGRAAGADWSEVWHKDG